MNSRLFLARIIILLVSFPTLLLADGTVTLDANGVMTISDTGTEPEGHIRLFFAGAGEMTVRIWLDYETFRDEVFLRENITAINVEMGEGDNRLTFGNFGSATTDVGFENVPFSYTGGSGKDQLSMYSTIIGDLTIDTGGGHDRVWINSLEPGEITVLCGAGSDNCQFNNCRMQSPGNSTIDMGPGQDYFSTGGASRFWGETLIDLGGGNDGMRMGMISNDFPHPNRFDGQLTILAGAGNDTLQIAGERSTYSGVTIDGQDGDDTVYSYMNTNYVDWNLFNLTVNVEFDRDTFRGRTDKLAEMQVNEVGGILRFRDEGNVADQIVTLSATDDPDMIRVELDNGTYTEVQYFDVSSVSEMRFYMGSGDDEVRLDDLDIEDIAVLVQTSSGDDVVVVDSSVVGPLEINTSTDDDRVEIKTDSIIFGDLEIQTQTGDDIVSIYDAICIGESELNTGDGTDFVEVDHSTFFQRVLVKLGDGNDLIRFREREGSTLAPNLIVKRLFVFAGQGNDGILFSGPGSYLDARLYGQSGADWMVSGAAVKIGSVLISSIENEN